MTFFFFFNLDVFAFVAFFLVFLFGFFKPSSGLLYVREIVGVRAGASALCASCKTANWAFSSLFFARRAVLRAFSFLFSACSIWS